MYKSLTIAGSDSGGCAGIQADIKAMSACGVFAMSAITAITAQNTQGVRRIEKISADTVAAQINAIYDDMAPDSLKSGMLFSKDIIDCTADILKERNGAPYVLDPVMIATSGDKLLLDDAADAMINRLFPLAALVTPNIPEAEAISGIKICSQEDIEKACRIIKSYGCGSVLIKGGHSAGDKSADILYDGERFYEISARRIDTKNTHGTGCSYSASIAAYLAKKNNMIDAVTAAKEYITGALLHGAGLNIGGGSGPVHHFFPFFKDSSGDL